MAAISKSESIRSADLTVTDLLSDFYVVPDYQREYVWGTEEVERLLYDINAEFARQTSDFESDYFIGSVVAAPRVDNAFELIDGQQRMTTIVVAICAIRDVLLQLNAPLKSIAPLLTSEDVDRSGDERARHRLDLQYEDARDTLRSLIEGNGDGPKEESGGELTRSQFNIVQAYRDTRAFLLEDLRGDASTIRRFFAFLTRRVKLIRITTPSVARALWIFETINARGRSLDAVDLLKNLLFRHADRREFDALKDRWKTLVDSLYAIDESPMRFVRYHILAHYPLTRLVASDVYPWLAENTATTGIESDPLAFLDSLLRDARVYTRALSGQLRDGTMSEPLLDILRLSRTARQHLILLMAASPTLSAASHARLAEELEKLLFVFVVTRQPKNYFESRFAEWSNDLRDVKSDDDLEAFLDRTARKERASEEKVFRSYFGSLRDTNLPKYRMKFILARLARHFDSLAYGEAPPLTAYLDKRIEIEHVVARNTDPGTLAGLPDGVSFADVVQSIANLTLLEKSINAAIGSQEISQKARHYASSRFVLTKSLSSEAQIVSPSTQPSQTIKSLPAFDHWDWVLFEARRESLTEVAVGMWVQPLPALPHAGLGGGASA